MNNYSELMHMAEESYFGFPDLTKNSKSNLLGSDRYHTDYERSDYGRILAERVINGSTRDHDKLAMHFICGLDKHNGILEEESYDEFFDLLKESGYTDDQIDEVLDESRIPFSNAGQSYFWRKFFDEYDLKPSYMCSVLGIDKNYLTRVFDGKARLSKHICFAVCMFFEFNEEQCRELLIANECCLCEDYGPDKLFIMMIRNKQYQFATFAELVYKFNKMVFDNVKGKARSYFKETQEFYANYDSFTNATYYGCFDENGEFNKRYGREKYNATRYGK